MIKQMRDASVPKVEIPIALFDRFVEMQLQNSELQRKNSEFQTTLHEMENREQNYLSQIKHLESSIASAGETHAKHLAELKNIANTHAKYNFEANATICEMKQLEVRQRREFDNLEAKQQSAGHFEPRIEEIRETIRQDTLRIERLKQGMASGTPYSVQSMELEEIALAHAKHNLVLGSLIEDIEKTRSYHLKQASGLGELTRNVQEINQIVQANMAQIEQIKTLCTTTKLTCQKSVSTGSTPQTGTPQTGSTPQTPLPRHATTIGIQRNISQTRRSWKHEVFGGSQDRYPQRHPTNQTTSLQGATHREKLNSPVHAWQRTKQFFASIA